MTNPAALSEGSQSLAKVSQRSVPSLTASKRTKLQQLELAQGIAGRMLKSWPDYGKATPEYIADMIATFALFSENVQRKLASLHGLKSRCSYLPAIKDAMELGRQYEAAEAASQPKRKETEKVISAEEQARVAKGMKALAESLKGCKVIEPEPPRPVRRPSGMSDTMKAELASVKERMAAPE